MTNLRVQRQHFVPPISRTGSASDPHRSGSLEAAEIFGKQHYAFCVDYLRTLQTALAGRVVFQMDQTASTHQEFLYNERKRSQDANMDCLH